MPLPEIDGYTVTERIGTGGFASVYAATRLADDEQVAIKVLHDHTSAEADLRRFEREAQTMRAFNGHPNIVSVFESGTTESGSHFAVLEFVGGGSVRDLLREQRALHWGEALRIGGQVASALDVAHRSGVLHRDVKPANILVDEENVKLSDFGIARLVGQSQVTAAQSIIGTLAYTPPEVFHGASFDGRGDIYQLGISMYEMLLGRPPFSSATTDNKATIIRRILDKPAPPLEQFDIPGPISDLLEQVLAKDPADRPQTAQRFAELIAEIETKLGLSPTIPLADRSTSTPTPPVDISDPTGSATVAMESPFDDQPVFPAQHEADLTVVGQSSDPNTVVMPVERVEQPETFKEQLRAGVGHPEASTPAVQAQPAATPPVVTAPPTVEPSGGSNRGKWLGALLALLIVSGAGAVFAFTQLDSGNTADGTATEEPEEEQQDAEPEVTAAFTAVATDVFSQPEASAGIVFDSVANSQGLTIVGSVGDGEQLPDQRSVVWTFGESGFAMRRDVTENAPHRMWGIGVIEGETFLAVGDSPGRDGIAWTGDRASAFTPVSSPDFTGDSEDYLRISIHDPSLGETFLVGGRRTEGAEGTPAIWEVAANPTWGNPEWTLNDIGSDSPGVINDIAVDGGIAAAVGMETLDGQDRALMKIRQDGEWSNLIGPVEDVELWGVTILDERIIAVGVQDPRTAPVPVAIIADTLGTTPRRHALPIRSGDGGVESGIARSVRTLSNGTVIVVGDVDRSLDPGNADAEIDKDGAIWELLPGNELGDDVWTTRVSSDLVVDGFVELWTIDEFDDTVYVFGRTETEDGRRPAGAWTLDLS